MGFLMGAFGKLQAGQRMRQIQYQLTGVQRKVRRAARDIQDREKMWKSRENQMNNQMTAQMNYYKMGCYAQAGIPQYGSWGNFQELAGMCGNKDFSTAMMIAQQTIQNMMVPFTQMSSMWKEQFEAERDADLQALKDYEEDLQLEKDNLESQLKIAQADYEANKEMEKQGAQNIKPDYTGQG